jgi:hypothetical protein
VLDDNTTVIAYGEFEIVEATDSDPAWASVWAQEIVKAAISAGIVPRNLQGKYQQAITRAEFVELTLAYLESASGISTIELLRQKNLIYKGGVFSDTDDAHVLSAYALEIVEGPGGGVFEPDGYHPRTIGCYAYTRASGAG